MATTQHYPDREEYEMAITRIIGAAVLTALLLAVPAGADPAAKAEGSSDAPEMSLHQGSVARASFTHEVIDREPTGDVTRLSNDHDRVFFFTELHQFEGQEVVHRWEFGGEVKAEVPFGVNGPRWRVYSSKTLVPSWLGTWTVSVVDAAGKVVAQESFDYVTASEPATVGKDASATPPGPAARAQ